MKRLLPVLLIAALVVAAAIGLGNCAGDDEEATDTVGGQTSSTSTTTTEPTATPVSPPKLPKGWREKTNAEGGFTIGLPPDWSISMTEEGPGSVFTSPDELLTMTVTADRTQGALQLPLDEFALRTAKALGSEVVGEQRIEDLKVGKAAPFTDAYEAVGVRAVGRSMETGVLERILVVVARDEGQAAFVFVARENAEKESQVTDRDTLKRLIRSLRNTGA